MRSKHVELCLKFSSLLLYLLDFPKFLIHHFCKKRNHKLKAYREYEEA